MPLAATQSINHWTTRKSLPTHLLVEKHLVPGSDREIPALPLSLKYQTTNWEMDLDPNFVRKNPHVYAHILLPTTNRTPTIMLFFLSGKLDVKTAIVVVSG